MAEVIIAIPHASSAKPDFNRYLISMQSKWPQHHYVYVEVDMMIIGKARNMCTELSVNTSTADVIWFVDDDVLVPENAGVLIDQAISLGVVSGVYYNRRPPYTPQVFVKATEPELVGKEMYWPDIDMPDSGLFQRDAVGAGCLAVSKHIFAELQSHYNKECEEAASKIEVPWIAHIVRNLSPWFEFLDKKGEDLYFCERLIGMGYPIWVNADVQCGHMGDLLVTRDYYMYLKENKLLNKEPRQ